MTTPPAAAPALFRFYFQLDTALTVGGLDLWFTHMLSVGGRDLWFTHSLNIVNPVVSARVSTVGIYAVCSALSIEEPRHYNQHTNENYRSKKCTASSASARKKLKKETKKRKRTRPCRDIKAKRIISHHFSCFTMRCEIPPPTAAKK